MGLIGGGQGSFIGRVHSIAAVMDHRAALVAGALSADPTKAKASAPDYGIAAEHAYGSYKETVAAEKKLPESERIDFVSVATPNNTHFEIAKAFAEAGFNVMYDRPMTFDLAQAAELAKVVQKAGVVFGSSTTTQDADALAWMPRPYRAEAMRLPGFAAGEQYEE